MLIAIDFDDTLTADPVMYRTCIAVVKSFGHRVICVTARRDTETNRDIVGAWMSENEIDLYTYYTSLESKVDYMERIGLKVDNWWDDDPRKCALGH